MGREAGFITMYTCLASRDVNVCLVPEFPFEIEGPNGLLNFVQKRVEARGHCVIVVAEGAGNQITIIFFFIFKGFAIKDADLKSLGTDASGNPKLPVRELDSQWTNMCIGCRSLH